MLEEENNEQKQEVVDTEPQVEEQEQEQEQQEVSGFTQEQVNDIVRNRLEKQKSSLYGRYGVESKEQLDELVGKAQSYDVMSEDYNALNKTFVEMRTENAFLKNNIDPARYDDIKAYFKGKDMEINSDTLQAELENHSEWVKQEKKTTIESLSSEEPSKTQMSEKEKVMEWFKGI